MSKEHELAEQRAIVATEIMGYKKLKRTCFKNLNKYTLWVYWKGGKNICEVRNYHPDLEDDRSLGQARDLKAMLRKLKVSYESGWDASEGGWALLRPWRLGVSNIATSGKTEGAALLEAASKLAKELAKESNNE